MPVRIFFPEPRESADPQVAVTCARCRVRAECLEYALTEDIRHGYFGGLSAAERKRRRSKAA